MKITAFIRRGYPAILAMGIYLVVFIAIAKAQEMFESPQPLKASDILSRELREGPLFRIDERVLNDGYMNTYTIHSKFGELSAVSTSSLKLRIAEIKAIDAMRQVEQTETFQESVVDAGKSTVEGVKNVVEDPKAAFSGAVTGIGKMFKRAGEAIQSKPGAGEDSRFEGLIGLSNTKREYAHAFGVDVYSPNPILQEQLDDMSRTGYAGSLSVTALKALIPGGVGLALSITDSTQLLNDMIAKTPPTELRDLNRSKLLEMKIDNQLVDLFINKAVFTPRDQTVLVAALEQLADTGNRSEFIKFAITTESEDVANFRTRVAIMYAVYNKQKAGIENFISLNPFLLGRAGDVLVFIVPVDYLFWTPETQNIVQDINRQASTLKGIHTKQLWVAGTVSEKSHQGLKDLGWNVFENCDESLDWRKMAKTSEPKS